MKDPRVDALAQSVIRYSCALQPGETVLIEAFDAPDEITCALIAAAHRAGGRPIALQKSNAVQRALLLAGAEPQWSLVADSEALLMANAQAYVAIRGSHNITELSDVPDPLQRIFQSTVWRRVHHQLRVPRTRWVVLRWPTPAFAQLAGMSTEAFEDYYFSVCLVDYARMSAAMQPLKAWMERTDRVRIVGPGETDLRFSIRGIPAVPLDGKINVPDGEILTAPVRDSVEGIIHFNCPTLYRGSLHDDVRLEFRGGKVVDARSSDSERLNQILDTDEGARFVGEFAIGFNPRCTRPIRDVLFDEKIAGSVHLALGNAYANAFNGNRSDIHWDLILIQRPEYGGGQLWFDDVLIRQDGRFVPEALQPLNPEHLGDPSARPWPTHG
jgi:aminopeptidase